MSESDLVRTQNAQAREIEQLLSIERPRTIRRIGQVLVTPGSPWSTVATTLPGYEFDDEGNVVLYGAYYAASAASLATLSPHMLPAEEWIWGSNKDDGFGDVRLATTGILSAVGVASTYYVLLGSHKYRMSSARAWTTFSGTNTWVSYGAGGYTTPGYHVSSEGVVTLKGLMSNGTPGNIGLSILTLPFDARPARYQMFLVNSGGVRGRVDVRPDGTVTCTAGASGVYISLDGIEFLTSWSPIKKNTFDLSAGWSHYDAPSFGTWDPGSWSIDSKRWVRLHGLVKLGTANTPAAVLPVGARPTQIRHLTALCGAGELISRVAIYPDGQIIPEILPANAYLNLHGAKFMAASG
jgi:hypothetical protein